MDRNRIISPREVEGLIADGHLIVIHEGDALKLDSWINKHPGGKLAIFHMIGRDATDEINVYHFEKTLKVMKAYRIGRVQLPWTNFEPPIRGGVYRKLGDDGPAQEVDVSVIDGETDASSEDGASSLKDSLYSRQDADPMSSSNSSYSDETDADMVAKENDTSKDDASTCVEGAASVRRRMNVHGAATSAANSSKDAASCPIATEKLSRGAYTAVMEQKEIADDIRNYPSLDAETQQGIRREYDILHEKVVNAGYYNCRYYKYGEEAIRYSILFGLFLFFLHIKWYLTSACFLAAFWQQIMFVAHDAGHRAITGNFAVDTVIGAFVADFCCGLSIGWWKSSHNVHHLITNMPEHDPDIQNVPLFANSPTFFKSVHSSFYKFDFVWDKAADMIVPYQKYTYYPIMAVARFNLYMLSWLHLVSPRAAQLGSAWWTRWLEIAFMACYWTIFGYGLVWRTLPDWPTRIAFVLVSHMFTMLLHVQITLSHWGTSTADLGPTESFAQRQLRTTMDVDCPEWLDWLHGGLQYQAVHHLFPRVPRHNLRLCQTLVREFCTKTGIEYQCYGFAEGNKVVLTRLEEIAKMVGTLVECQNHMAETNYMEIE